MADMGMTQKAIADELCVHRDTIYEWLKSVG